MQGANGPAARWPRGRSDLTALTTAAAAGDEWAWESIVREFGALVWTIARRHRLSDEDAADAVQSTWAALVAQVAQIRDPARLRAWLVTTARRECLRSLRKAAREIPLDLESAERRPSAETIDDALLLRERNRALARGLGRLRKSDQELLGVLMTEPSARYEAVSAKLGIPVGSIGPTRARALRRLRREIDRDGARDLMS